MCESSRRGTGRSILELARSGVLLGAILFSAVLLAVSARPAEAAVTFVKSLGTAASATTGTTIGVTVPAGGAAAGNSIILTLSLGDAPGDVSAADTSGNAYSVAADATNAAHVRTVILAAHNVSALAAGSTITITHPSVSASAVSAAEFSGISKVAALDGTSSATGTGTGASSGLTSATTLANELLIGAIGVEGPLGDAFTAGAGFTGLPRAGSGIGVRGSSSGSANGSSLSIAAPAGVVAGDVLLASVDVEGGSGSTITASGWTLVRRDDSSTVLGQATYYRVAGASEPASYSFGIPPSRRASGGIIAYTNVDNGAPINASGGKVNASSSSITAPSINTTAANAVVVGFFGIANNGAITPPAGLSGRYSATSANILGSAGADGFQTVAGATGTKVATCTSSAVNIGHLVALTPTIASSFATINPEYRIVSSAAAYQADGTLGASKDWAAAIATFRQGVCGDGFTDPGESCDLGASNGASDACCSATCGYKSSGTQCRAAVGECDQVETCSGSSAFCPVDANKAAGASCSSDGNACTKDQCDGASVTCQHPVGNAGTVCRAASSACDVAETCTGTDTTCPVDTIKPSGTVCRAAAGVCDVAETCTGTDTVCPVDGKQASGTACTADSNACTLDQCNGVSNTCQHPAGNAGAVCRAAAGTCDVADTCTGTSTTCPTDLKVASGTVCRPAAGVCDVAESCTGSSSSCPSDAFRSTATTCRAAVDECDKADMCSGSSALCPADAMKSSGTACSSDGNACTKDQCNGASVTCQHPAGNAGSVCRAAAGGCDVAETCTGTATTCPVDTIKTSGTVCRASAGVCDVAEACTGTDTTCPVDGKKSSGTVCTADSNPCTLDQCNGASSACQHPAGNAGAVCRIAAGACDVADACTGTSTSCPTDVKLASGTVCRPAAGDCDVAESCTGQAKCPDDVFKPATTVCRASTDVCDYAEHCNASASCPADTYVPGTTACWAQNLGTNGNETPSTLISIPVAGNVVLGRTVIVTVAMDPNAGAVTCADNKGNIYSRDADTTNGAGTTGVRALAFSAPVTNALQTGDTISVTFQNTTACKAVSVAEFVGIAGVDQTAGAIGDGISPSSGPTSPTAQPNELLLGVIGVETKLNQKFTGGAGYTVLPREQSDPNAGSPGRHVTIDPEYRFVRETGSYAADGTLSGPRLWAASIVTYRSGIGGPGSICGNGDLEQGEDCDAGSANGTNSSCCTASCTVSDAGQVCRAAAGQCDFAETCTGLSAVCPADEQLPAGSACADEGNPCTLDVCDGFNVACGHPAGNAGLVCRPSAGGCDLAESCDGAANVCPADAVQSAGTECRPSAGVCDLSESCDGAANVCPADAVQSAGTECRPAAGECDLAESCDGAANVCPADAVQSAGTECRPAAGGCDLAESCDGAAIVCPVDALKTAGTECRPAAGTCDLAESCDGAVNVCPADAFQSAGTECRASTAGCDPAESCTGTAASCPTDDLNQASEVTGVTLVRDPSMTTIAWAGDVDDLFNVYRGSLRAGTAWSYNHSCMETAVAGLSITDTLDPGPGTVFYYLVSREGQCGESVLGRNSIASLIQEIPMVGQCLAATPDPDSDGDGVEDALDNCPAVANPNQTDVDQDEHGVECDNCPDDFNPGQTDTDHDGIGNACDPTP